MLSSVLIFLAPGQDKEVMKEESAELKWQKNLRRETHSAEQFNC